MGRGLVVGMVLIAALAFGSGRAVFAQSASSPGSQAAAKIIGDWPPASQAAARDMLQKYGAPQESAPTMLIWKDNGPWLRTVVHKTPVEHDFPVKHQDVLEQVVPYRVPLNMFTPLATFDGSVIADRTRGELAAHCDNETTNILALNLAQDIIRGMKTAQQARDAMAAAERDIQAGRVPTEAQKLLITKSQEGDVRDPDTPVVMPR